MPFASSINTKQVNREFIIKTIAGGIGQIPAFSDDGTIGSILNVAYAPDAFEDNLTSVLWVKEFAQNSVLTNLTAGSNDIILATDTIVEAFAKTQAQINGLTSGGGASTLATLTDVQVTTPATNQLLQYNGTKWANWTPNFLTTYTETDTLATVTGRGATTATALAFTNTTASSSTSTGALVVSGGVGVAGSLYAAALFDNGNRVLTSLTDTLATVTGRGATTATALAFTNATASSSTSTGALVVSGGLGVGGSVYAAALFDNGVRVSTTTHTHTLATLSDFQVGTPATNQLLQYNGTKWVNWTPNFLSASTSADIEITNAASGLILRSPSGARWRVTIENDGGLNTTAI